MEISNTGGAALFTLKPFVPNEPEHFAITCSISRDDSVLHVCFTLRGPLHHLRIPLPAKHPERRDNLWQESCFEFFFAEVGSEVYWEVNLAPSGHWNVFRFDSYRQGMQREENVASLPCRIVFSPQTFTLKAALDLGCMSLRDKPMQAGISAVLQSKSNNLSCWALAHPCGKPDFHDRKGFLLTL